MRQPIETVSTSTMVRYQGVVELAAGNVASIEAFFSEQFGHTFKLFGDLTEHDSSVLEGDFAAGVGVRGHGQRRPHRLVLADSLTYQVAEHGRRCQRRRGKLC